ncbi:MAG: hotdog fold thioesterase [Rhodospirillales bacterium]|nr:hotdog fold thioesterase [Rhodospirillales bacterium]MCB9965663.1 hotdog fold thioesterase [Rhodospirillales bacterium]MCB9973089.1 hotdog fold thioesterase [Rhodospirillales bacterium]
MWYQPYSLEDLSALGRDGGMARLVGLELVEIGADYLKGQMPVDERTKQPFGILHGGASCVLSESLGSIAAWMCINPETQRAVGLEINANHIRSVTEGLVTGLCRPLHVGRRTQVWQTDIFNEVQKMVCTSRLTVAILDR